MDYMYKLQDIWPKVLIFYRLSFQSCMLTIVDCIFPSPDVVKELVSLVTMATT